VAEEFRNTTKHATPEDACIYLMAAHLAAYARLVATLCLVKTGGMLDPALLMVHEVVRIQAEGLVGCAQAEITQMVRVADAIVEAQGRVKQ
jgi:hypothetical protein